MAKFETADSLLDAMVQAQPKSSAASLPPYSIQTPEAERLRRFLAFCLAVDYRCFDGTNDMLSKEDWRYFVDLADRCFVPKHIDPTRTTSLLDAGVLHYEAEVLGSGQQERTVRYDGELRDPAPEVEAEIVRPAKELGVPSAIVASMLLGFVCSMMSDSKEPYRRSSHSWIFGKHRIKDVEWKLYWDRKILFDAVLPERQAYRDAVMKQWSHACQRYVRKNGECECHDPVCRQCLIQSREKGYEGSWRTHWRKGASISAIKAAVRAKKRFEEHIETDEEPSCCACVERWTMEEKKRYFHVPPRPDTYSSPPAMTYSTT